MTAKAKRAADLQLQAFLEEGDSARCDQLLQDLVYLHARPVIERVTASKLNVKRGHWDIVEWQDREDIAEEVVVQLVRRVKRLKSDGAASFTSFEDYVAAAAHNACSNYLRRKYPERSRLRDKLRYILSHHEQFAIWRDDEQGWLCGFSEWANQRRSLRSSERLRQLNRDPALIKSESDSARQELELLRLIKAILEFVGDPITFDELVDLAGAASGERRKTGEASADRLDHLSEELCAGTEDILTERVDKRAYLEQVWREICELPGDQRVALLLNLKDSDGSDVTAIFVSCGVATVTDIAMSLCLTIEEFLDVWKRLPLTDEDIAVRLGVRVRQVGSLRQSGRRRLARRMDLYERQKGFKAGQA